MILNILEEYLNKQIQLEVLNEINEKIGPSYEAKIIKIINENEICISYPSFRNISIPFPENSKVKMILEKNSKKIKLLCKVISQNDNCNKLFVESSLYNNFNTSQKRVFYRVNCKLKAECKVICSDDTECNEVNFYNFTANTLDISAGGVSIVTSTNLEINSIIKIIIELKKNIEITVIGKIVRKNSTSRENSLLYGVEFVSISDRELDKLTKFIFELQRKL
jgi:c-di-GMP-binding flagellar brake protein YcgR